MSYPVIYAENATDFFNLGLGTLPDATKVEVAEERNGEFTLVMTYLVDGLRANEIKKNRIIKVDAGHVLKGQRFVIKKINKQLVDRKIQYQVYAEHVSYITNDLQLKPKVSVSGSGDAAIKAWRSNIIDVNPLVVDSDIETNTSTSWTIDKVQSARQALGGVAGSLLDLWGGEYRFDNYHISLKKQRGTVSNTLLSYGRNITDFDQEENITDTYTSVYPYATYTETTENSSDSESKLLTLPELTIDSKYVGNYPNRKILPVDLTAKFAAGEKPTEAKLREFAKSYVTANDIGVPKVSIKLSFVDLSQSSNYEALQLLEVLDLCDTVPVRFTKLGVDTKTKVSRVVWNVLADHYTSMELGDTRYTIGDMINNALNTANEANQNSQEAQNSANHAVLSADGHTMIYYGPGTPIAKNIGDIWYKPDGEYEIMYRWDGKVWSFVMSTRDTAEAKDAADAAQKEAEEAQKKANDAVNQANQAVTDAGFAKQQVVDVDKTANQAKSDAAEAGQQAKDALTNAGTALTNAKNALDNVTKLDQTVKTEVTNINGQLAQKVSQTTFDTLKGTVTSQGTLINQNKAEIQLKADLSLVNTIKQTVTNNTAAIDLNSKEIKLKASQSDVDKLGGRVTDAEAQIKLQADQIKLTVSKTELTNILGDYATETWTQSQIKSTTDSINLSVSRVQSNLDNLSIGARNYLDDTSTQWQTQGYGVTNQVSLNKWLFTFGTIKQAPFKDGEYVTVSFDYTSVGTGAYGTISPKFNDTPWGQFNDGEAMKDNGHVVRTVQWKSNWTTSGTATGIQIRMDNVATTRTVTVYNMQFERGNKDTDWKQAPEDMATVEKLSELQVTVNGIQGTVQNKADQSQVTQMAGQITSLIGSANNPNLIPNSGLPKDTLFWRTNDTTRFKVATHSFYTKGSLFALLAPQGTAERTAGTATVSVTRGATYTASLGVFGDSNVFGCDVLWIGRKHGETTDTKVLVLAGNFKPNPSKIELKSWAFNVGDCDEGYIRVDNNGSTSGESTLYFGEVKLEKGGRYTPWEQTAESSEIVQTREMINLRVQKGDVINQINISPESILIAGQKVHITGQTTIDNAVIKDAMIADIKADKITAGTINAANVNVINLNANNITTGTLKGANLSMNLNTGEILFQKGSIKSTNGKLNIDINDGTLSVMSSAKSGVLFYDGNMYLSTISGGFFNPLVDKPKYGSITYTDNFLNYHPGMRINGSEGLLLLSGKDAVVGSFVETDIVDGLGILLGPDNIYIGGDNNTAGSIITGGKKYQGYFIDDRASVSVGDGDSSTDATINGKTIDLTFSPGGIATTDQGGLFRLSKDERSQYALSVNTYDRTYSSGAAMTIMSSGVFGRISSASKYKLAIGEISTLNDEAHQFLSVKPKQWFDKSESEALADTMTTGNTDYIDDAKALPHTGFIAEDLYTAGLDNYVIRGNDGSIESIQYDRLPVLHHELIRELFNRLDAAEMEIYKLKQEVINNAS